jgi:PPP family 3-phenylpropionic acid transporter
VPSRPIVLRFYYFTAFAALGVYLPFFPRWLEARGIDGFGLGLVAATLPAMGVLGPPLFGLVADALGLRGFLLRLTCAGAFVGFSGITALALAGDVRLGALLFAALVFSFFRSPTVMLADVVALEQSRHAGVPYGRTRLWGSLGFLAGTVLGGRLVDPTHPVALPATISAGLFAAFLATFALPARIPPPPRPVPGHVRALMQSPDMRLFLVCTFLAEAAHVAYDLCFSLHLFDRGASRAFVGDAWALGVITEIALMGFAGKMEQRLVRCSASSQSELASGGEESRALPGSRGGREASPSGTSERSSAPNLLALAFGGAALRWLLIAAVPGRYALLALQPLHAISFALMWVSSLAFLKARAPAHILATAQGLFLAVYNAGGVAGMLLWGPLYRRAGGAFTFGVASVLALVACVLGVVFAQRARSEDARMAAEIS